MHSPDETVDEEDVAPRQLSLIKMSGWANSRDDMLAKARGILTCCSPPYCATKKKTEREEMEKLKSLFKQQLHLSCGKCV